MTDNLRDRIAKVLYGNLRRQQGIDRPDRFLDWIDTSELAVAVIEALGLKQESCVQYTHAPRFVDRGLDACEECFQPVTCDQESAAALLEKLNSRDRRFQPEPVIRST